MKNVYVAMANTLIDFSEGAKAYISLIGVFDIEEKAKQAVVAYSCHYVTDEHNEDQAELAENIAELCEIKMVELNKMYPDLEFDYAVY